MNIFKKKNKEEVEIKDLNIDDITLFGVSQKDFTYEPNAEEPKPVKKSRKRRGRKKKEEIVEEPKVEEPKVEEPKVEEKKVEEKKEEPEEDVILNNLKNMLQKRGGIPAAPAAASEAAPAAKEEKKEEKKDETVKVLINGKIYKITIDLEKETDDDMDLFFINDKDDNYKLNIKISKKIITIQQYSNGKWSRNLSKRYNPKNINNKITLTINPSQIRIPVKVFNLFTFQVKRVSRSIPINIFKTSKINSLTIQ
jgi:biotin carboxyl carrier protein